MKKENEIKLCPHCGNPLTASEIAGYSWQCAECEEDFCDFEVISLIKA